MLNCPNICSNTGPSCFKQVPWNLPTKVKFSLLELFKICTVFKNGYYGPGVIAVQDGGRQLEETGTVPLYVCMYVCLVPTVPYWTKPTYRYAVFWILIRIDFSLCLLYTS